MKENIKATLLRLLDSPHFIEMYLASREQAEFYLEAAVADPSVRQAVFDEIDKIMDGFVVNERQLTEDEKLMIWNMVKANTVDKTRKARRTFWAWGISAVTAAAIILGAIIYLSVKNNSEVSPYQMLADIDMKRQEHIELIKGDTTIRIDSDKAEIIYDRKGNLSIAGKDKIEAVENGNDEVNQLLVPYGKSTFLTMSDGTKVWVNSGSRLVYPKVFRKDKRVIYVDGEIYLEVQQNDRCPFIVNTDKMDVTVLGTRFNVRAYNDSEKFLVSLEEGAVKVYNKDMTDNTSLVPDQVYAYNIRTGEASVRKENVSAYSAWKNGFLIFESERIENVLSQLERYYNIIFKLDSVNLKDIMVSGKLDLKESCDKVLAGISLTAPISFHKTSEDRFLVYSKNTSANY